MRALISGAGELAREIVSDFAPEQVLSSESTKLIRAIFDDTTLKEAGRVVYSNEEGNSHCVVSFGVDSAVPNLGRLSLRRWQLGRNEPEFFTVDVQPPDAEQRVRLCTLWQRGEGRLTYRASESRRLDVVEAIIDELYSAFTEKRIEANAERDLPGGYREGWVKQVRPRA